MNYARDIRIVLTAPNGDGVQAIHGAHQERWDDVKEKYLGAEPLSGPALAAALPNQAALIIQVQQLTDDLAAMTAERDALQTAVTAADTTRDTALAQVETLQADKAQLTTDLAAMTQETAVATAAQAAAEAQRDALADQVAELTAPPADPAVTNAQARLALKAAGLFAPINAHMMGLPEDDAARIHWEFSPYFHRSNPVLAEVAETFGLQSAQIDQLFAAAAAF